MKKPFDTASRPAPRRAAMALCLGAAFAGHATAQDVPQVLVNASLEEPYAPSHATVGGKTPQRLIDIPQSATVFSAERIRDQNLFTLGDLMQQAPGVSVMPFDGANPDFRARGYAMELSYDSIPASQAGRNSSWRCTSGSRCCAGRRASPPAPASRAA